jgi:hypothetical protein
LYPVTPAKVNTDTAWLGLGSLYITALASKCFGDRVYSQAALEICDISEEILSGMELLNEVQSLITGVKWAKELRKASNAEDFFVRRVQMSSKIIFSSAQSFCNTIKIGFLLQRIRIISLSSVMQKQLEKTHSVFAVFQQTFALFQDSYQLYLCSSLKGESSQRIKKELDQKCKLSLMSIAETVAKIFIATLEKASKKMNASILVLSSFVLALKISLYLCDKQFSHMGKWRFSANRFIYTC